MANYITSDEELTSIADAVRAKTGKTAGMTFPTGFVSEIGGLNSTYDATATISDVVSGKTFYANGEKLTGINTQTPWKYGEVTVPHYGTTVQAGAAVQLYSFPNPTKGLIIDEIVDSDDMTYLKPSSSGTYMYAYYRNLTGSQKNLQANSITLKYHYQD